MPSADTELQNSHKTNEAIAHYSKSASCLNFTENENSLGMVLAAARLFYKSTALLFCVVPSNACSVIPDLLLIQGVIKGKLCP